jgi:hypothetical protein
LKVRFAAELSSFGAAGVVGVFEGWACKAVKNPTKSKDSTVFFIKEIGLGYFNTVFRI